MTKPSNLSVHGKKTIGLYDRPGPDFRHDPGEGVMRADPYEPLITSAILTATAFRMRDNEALIEALRMLVRVVQPFESRAAEDAG